MTFEYPGSGQSNVAEFMMSPLPFVTQSSAGTSTPIQINFPYITSHWSVKNNSSFSLEVGFTVSGTLGGNRFTIAPSASFGPVPMRVKTMYFLGSGGTVPFDIMAGLTLINPRTFPVLTGSAPVAFNITSSVYENSFSYPTSSFTLGLG